MDGWSSLFGMVVVLAGCLLPEKGVVVVRRVNRSWTKRRRVVVGRRVLRVGGKVRGKLHQLLPSIPAVSASANDEGTGGRYVSTAGRRSCATWALLTLPA